MPSFSYSALTADGKPREGMLDAATIDQASRELRSQGLTLLRLESGRSGFSASGDSAAAPTALRRQEVLSLTHELAVLLRAGLPLDRALKVLLEMAATPQMSQLLNSLLTAVKGGKSFSEALQPHQPSFGNFYINMVRSGEASGHLAGVLERLVEYLENAKTARDSVVSSLIYPTILLVVAVLSVIAMLGFVVPQFEALFEDMGEALPLMTRMVIATANGIKAYGWVALLGGIGGGLWLRNWLRTDHGRRTLHERLLKLPMAGELVFQFELAKFARTLGTLLGNGVALLKAISIAVDTVGNVVIKESLDVLPPAVKAGERIYATLEATGRFNPMIVQMIRVGEESGRLEQMMLELARVFDQNVQSGVKRSLTVLEPALILLMGAMIAVIIISILMGILSVNDLAL